MSKYASQNKEISNGRNKSGQFLMGHTGSGGRPKGSRNRLGEQFIEDVYRKWKRHGGDVIDRVIREDPAQFLKTVAAILPKELHAELDVNVELFARARTYSEAYDMALKFIGAEVDEPVLVEASDAAE